MARVHISRPLQDNTGALLTDASVAVYDPGTTTPISQDLFEGLTGPTTKTNPFDATDGHVDFYLDTAANVRIGITRPSLPEFFIEDIAVGDPEEVVEEAPIQTVVLQWQGDLVVGNVAAWVVPQDATLVDVRATVTDAPTDASAIIDVLNDGTSLWDSNAGNRPTIAASSTTALGGAADSTALTAGDVLLAVIDQIGSTLPGKNLTVAIRYQVTA